MKDSDEELEIRESVRRLAEREIPKYQNERFYGSTPRELFQSFASLGLTGLAVEEHWGGNQAGAVTTSIVMEETARVDLGPAIFLSVHNMVCGLINRFGSQKQKSEYLPKLSNGELLAAYALTEPSAGSDAAALKTSFRCESDQYVLNGEKCYISSAGWADLYVVFARSGNAADESSPQISAFLVPGRTAGLSVAPPEKKMGCELSPIASMNFQEMKLPAEALLGTMQRGYAIALSGLEGGRINIASCANGISRACIERALAHLKERQQFGKRLIEFQGLQFMLADMQMKLAASLALTRQAAQELDQRRQQPGNERSALASVAKCFASDCAMQIATDAVQLLGGAGYIKEYQVERYMRDAKMLQIVEGTNQIQRVLIAREMLGD